MRQRGEDLQLVDVRNDDEFAAGHISGATHIPLPELPDRLAELDRNRLIVLQCHRGIRSMRALETLRGAGYTKLKSLRGGIDAWSTEVDSSVPRY